MTAPLGHDVAPVLGPWPGFAAAALAAVQDLHARFPLDLWMVTHVDGDDQTVVAAAGPWAAKVAPGLMMPWARSFCLRMVATGRPLAEPDVHAVPDLAPLAVGARAHVRAYVGAPLLADDQQLFGSVCALSGTPQAPDLAERVLPAVHLYGRLLSTVVAGEQRAEGGARELSRAHALAEADPLTGLRNRRGWDSAVSSEQQRARRYGSATSVLALDLDGLKQVNDRAGHAAGDAALVACADVLRATCRPGDVLVRLGGDEFAVLAVECDAVSALALGARLRQAMRLAGVAVSIGHATRRAGESLAEVAARADAGLYRDKDRRTGRRAADRRDVPLRRV